MRQTKQERRAYINTRSEELARSGKYKDWQEIELALRVEGFPEARGELDSRFKREWLNKLCEGEGPRRK